MILRLVVAEREVRQRQEGSIGRMLWPDVDRAKAAPPGLSSFE
jgi:hypothetical protein